MRIAYATGIGRPMGAGPQDRNAADVPFEIISTPGHATPVWLVGALTGPLPAGVSAAATLRDALTAWNGGANAGKRGLIILTACDRSSGATAIPVTVHPGAELHIVAGQFVAPQVRADVPVDAARLGYLVRRDRMYGVDALLRVTAQPAGSIGGRLVLDGLSCTAGVTLQARALDSLLVRHCTLRLPGGDALATSTTLAGTAITIDHCIAGRIALDAGTGTTTGRLTISDSVVAQDGAAGDALSAGKLDTLLCNVTVIGPSRYKTLDGTNVLLMAAATVTRTQAGCLRYSWVAPGSVVPRRFRCQPDLAIGAAAASKGSALTAEERTTAILGMTPALLDTSIDEPTLAMLHPRTPDGILLGGEGAAEMGAFSTTAAALRMANVRSLFDDYLPFGTAAGLIDDTRSSAVALRRNRP